MDITGFNTLASQLRPRLHEAATRWLAEAPRGCDTPDDVVQDTLLRLWAVRDTLESYSSVEALAMVSARRTAIDAMRRSASRPAGTIDDHIDLETDFPAPDDAADLSIAEALASRLLIRLPDRQALVVKMRHADGLEMAEIASLTGMTEGNIRTLLTRGRQRLRQLYESSIALS